MVKGSHLEKVTSNFRKINAIRHLQDFTRQLEEDHYYLNKAFLHTLRMDSFGYAIEELTSSELWDYIVDREGLDPNSITAIIKDIQMYYDKLFPETITEMEMEVANDNVIPASFNRIQNYWNKLYSPEIQNQVSLSITEIFDNSLSDLDRKNIQKHRFIDMAQRIWNESG